MEICSLHHTESQGYEMRVASLLDSLPDCKNLRKTNPKSTTQGQSTVLEQSLTLVDMKRIHTERDVNLKKGRQSSRITSKLTTTQVQCSTNVANRTEMSEFHSSRNNSSPLGVTDCEIFLGGSCNPTSWRKDIVIPILNHSGISFFNPQVPSWCPELMAAENEAKSLANFLFFVIDPETRAVASLVEVAYLIAQGKNVILVMAGLPLPGNVICGDTVTESEIRDLAYAQKLLRQLSIRNNVRVFECIRTAVQTTASLLRQRDSDRTSKSENGFVRKSENGHECNSGRVSHSLPSTTIISGISSKGQTFDVFLGGTSLTKEQLGNLEKSRIRCWTLDSCDPSSLLDDPRIDETKILFFHLSNSFRAVETLILAAYYVGLSRNVVLCIENLGDGCVVGNEVLSKIAVKDYNRGRCYLRDVAERHKVPIFCTVSSALDAIVSQLTPSAKLIV